MILEKEMSKKLCAMTLEIYRQLGEVHTKGDPVVSWGDVTDSQRVIKCHLRALNHIFKIGLETNQDRVWRAKELRSTVIPMLSLMVKDHKPCDDKGNPKT